MAVVQDLIRDQQLLCVDVNQSVLEVARFMVDHNIGAVPVLRQGELAGIFSERDLMNRIVAEGRDPAHTMVFEVMTPDPFIVSPEETIENCMAMMRQQSFRHLVVCRGRELKGLLSMRDILLHGLVERDGEVQMMRAYIAQSS